MSSSFAGAKSTAARLALGSHNRNRFGFGQPFAFLPSTATDVHNYTHGDGIKHALPFGFGKLRYKTRERKAAQSIQRDDTQHSPMDPRSEILRRANLEVLILVNFLRNTMAALRSDLVDYSNDSRF